MKMTKTIAELLHAGDPAATAIGSPDRKTMSTSGVDQRA
jgi:hypothetical protein